MFNVINFAVVALQKSKCVNEFVSVFLQKKWRRVYESCPYDVIYEWLTHEYSNDTNTFAH